MYKHLNLHSQAETALKSHRPEATHVGSFVGFLKSLTFAQIGEIAANYNNLHYPHVHSSRGIKPENCLSHQVTKTKGGQSVLPNFCIQFGVDSLLQCMMVDRQLGWPQRIRSD